MHSLIHIFYHSLLEYIYTNFLYPPRSGSILQSASCIDIEITTMGRKVSQASVKISKEDKQQFNSLIKVLRPKVYITDSSSFKKLVQELTGNGNSNNNNSQTSLSPPPLELEPNMVENWPIMMMQGTETQRDPETSPDISVSPDATCNSSSPELCYDALMNEEFNQVCDQLCLDDLVFQDSVANQSMDHFLAYQNLESLLFDVEPNPLYNFYEQMEQPDVSIYDYEVSGLL
ncbi:hypothetical protein RJT34_00350 [Clitoria ternatea]|uniref:VQ domain-containing protein n=1 Tax=Clitoria ternatea TaxID=43366 RepID=A0AAN9KFN8_CLITE